MLRFFETSFCALWDILENTWRVYFDGVSPAGKTEQIALKPDYSSVWLRLHVYS
jgi:hypothetical protein